MLLLELEDEDPLTMNVDNSISLESVKMVSEEENTLETLDTVVPGTDRDVDTLLPRIDYSPVKSIDSFDLVTH
jgi:hypothetical protein